MAESVSRVVAAAVLGAAVAVGGLWVGQGLEGFRTGDRSVTIKGLAEQAVPADFALWSLTFKRAGNEFGAVQKALASDRDSDAGQGRHAACRFFFRHELPRIDAWPARRFSLYFLFVALFYTYFDLSWISHAERIRLKNERVTHWLSQGAVATDRVAKFLGKAGLAPMPAFREQPKQSAPKKKAQERAAAAAAG